MGRKSFQDAVLDRMTDIAAKWQLKVVEAKDYANTGTLVAQVQADRGWTTVCRASYAFSSGHNKVSFNGAELGTDDAYLFAEYDDDKVNAMFTRWTKLCATRPRR